MPGAADIICLTRVGTAPNLVIGTLYGTQVAVRARRDTAVPFCSVVTLRLTQSCGKASCPSAVSGLIRTTGRDACNG